MGQNQAGFNKVEILVLLTIVIVLTFIFLGFVFDVEKSARDAKRRGDIEEISKQLETHFNRQPNQFCDNSPIDSYCPPEGQWFEKNKIPTDPLSGSSYLNLPQLGDKKFMICAKLEKETTSLQEKAAVTLGANSGYYYCSSSQQ